MEHEIYETRIFEMKADPETKRKTICLEVELEDSDFDEMKEHWVDNKTTNIKIVNTL